MAQVDRSTLRATIRFRGDYQNVRKFPNADVDREIQKSFGEFYELVDNAHQGYWDTEADVVTIASQGYVALPGDAWRVLGIDRVDGDSTIAMDQIGPGERNRYGSTPGEPCAYRLVARGANLYPTPDAVYTLRMTYTPTAPLLQDSVAREWYNGWEDYVIESTLIKLDSTQGKPLSDRKDTLGGIIARISAGVAKRRSQEPEYLNLREGGGGDLWRNGDD